jgi:hypothetical protein
MAKKKGGVNKSAAVREYMKDHPGASANEVAEALGQQGINISPALVYNVRANDNKKQAGSNGAAKRGRSAKGAAHGSKADAIREAFNRLGPSSRARDIIADLAKQGMEVTSAHVSNVRARMESEGKSARRAAGGAARGGSGGGETVSIEKLVQAKNMAEKLGGIESARRMLDALAKLSS